MTLLFKLGALGDLLPIKNHPLLARSIRQPARLLLFAQRTSQQISEKQGTQGFDWLRGQSRQKARERRAGKQVHPSKERQ
jgi:hypothetical protein